VTQLGWAGGGGVDFEVVEGDVHGTTARVIAADDEDESSCVRKYRCIAEGHKHGTIVEKSGEFRA